MLKSEIRIMKIPCYIRCVVLLIAVIALFPTASSGEASHTNKNGKPNIILILADDLGYGDLSCYGSVRINTPRIDQMAQEGLRFSQFYAGSAVCTPTRVSIMTGRSPLRFNVSRHFNDQEMHLREDVPTIPKMLKKAGYVSMHIGKWHLGGLNEKHVNDRANSIPGPIEHGFDHYLAMLEDPLYRRPAMLEKRLYKDGAKHLVRDDEIIKPIDDHWTDVKTNEALRFLESSVEGNKPFYLNLWFDAPHAPYEAAPENSLNPYKERAKGDDLLYRSMVAHLDYSIGRILDKLNELGISENTLIIFSSDNGPAYQGSPGPFKGRKVDFHEGGIRVPGIAWWPGSIKAGGETNELAHTNDLLPTFCALGGVQTDKLEIDGKNILPLLIKGKPVPDRGYVFWQIDHYNRNGNYAVVTDKRPEPVATEVVRKNHWKLLSREGEPIELYNLEEDPYERWNLINQYPEIVEELERAVKNWLDEPRMSRPY